MKKQIPLFMSGYAAHVIENHFPEDMNKGILSELRFRVYRILEMYRLDHITVDEAMRRLSEPFFSWEDISHYAI